MLLPYCCQSPLSAARVYAYSRYDFVTVFELYHYDLVKAHHQLTESA
jgi:hypothetical protein